MTSTHEALVRRSFGEVQQQLQDTDWVLAALPGSTLTRDPDGASGSLRLKLDGQQITYRVTIRGTGPDEGVHAVTVAVSGKEARGGGILAATVQIELHKNSGDGSGDGTGDDTGDETGSTLLRAILDVTATGRGESVSEDGWGRVADSVLAGVVDALNAAPAPSKPLAADPSRDDAVTAAPTPATRPAPVVDSPSLPTVPARRSTIPPPHLLAAAAAVLAMICLVLRRRSRRRAA
jgi:carbon monoxide dehydrogenase subunit G